MTVKRKSTSQDDAPFDLVKARMTAGLLPPTRDVEVLDDVMTRDRCALCESEISEGRPRFVLRWKRTATDESSAALHPLCHGIWLVVAKKGSAQPVHKRTLYGPE
jgi:hypothetical protein